MWQMVLRRTLPTFKWERLFIFKTKERAQADKLAVCLYDLINASDTVLLEL